MALADINSHDIFKQQSRSVVNAVFPILNAAEAVIHSTCIFKGLVNSMYLQSGCVTAGKTVKTENACTLNTISLRFPKLKTKFT